MAFPTTLHIQNNVQYDHLDIIRDFFEKYQLGKVNSVVHSSSDNSAVLKLDHWYDNNCAKNMCERIYQHGETRIIYDDPNYFTVKFLDYQEEDTIDSRDEYIKRENYIQNDYDEHQYDNDHENQSHDEREDEEVNHANNCCFDTHDDYLEDDVIENTTNIERLFRIVEELKLYVVDSKKTINSLERRLGNISKKTNIMYKNIPRTKMQSVWEGRLRRRIN